MIQSFFFFLDLSEHQSEEKIDYTQMYLCLKLFKRLSHGEIYLFWWKKLRDKQNSWKPKSIDRNLSNKNLFWIRRKIMTCTQYIRWHESYTHYQWASNKISCSLSSNVIYICISTYICHFVNVGISVQALFV